MYLIPKCEKPTPLFCHLHSLAKQVGHSIYKCTPTFLQPETIEADHGRMIRFGDFFPDIGEHLAGNHLFVKHA